MPARMLRATGGAKLAWCVPAWWLMASLAMAQGTISGPDPELGRSAFFDEPLPARSTARRSAVMQDEPGEARANPDATAPEGPMFGGATPNGATLEGATVNGPALSGAGPTGPSSASETVVMTEEEFAATYAPGEGATISLFNPENRLQVTGGLDTLAVWSTSRVFPAGLPLLVPPDSPFGLDTNSFDVHARQSYLAAQFSGPKAGSFEIGGNLLLFVQNDNLSADDYGLLVYQAFGEVKNDRWRFAAGLQPDVFNPLNPSIVYLTKLYGSGNSGSYRGQLRVERFFQPFEDVRITWQGALSEPISTLVNGNSFRIEEDNGWPNLETRLEFAFGDVRETGGGKTRPVTWGVSGVVGQFRNSRIFMGGPAALSFMPREVIDTRGVGVDLEWWVTEDFGFRGEFFHGQGLGEYNAGVQQSYNAFDFSPVRATGGFGEVFAYLTPRYHVHAGYGIDDPRSEDLAFVQILRNQTYFVNQVFDVTKTVQLSLQVDYRKTDYVEFVPGLFQDSDAVVVATRFLWRF